MGRDGYYIIDGDSHVLEPPDLWDEYLENEYRPRAICITRTIEAAAQRAVSAGVLLSRDAPGLVAEPAETWPNQFA